MDSKKIRKNIGYLFGYFTLNTCSLIIGFLPPKWLYSFANGFAALAYRILGKHRRIALNSLEIAFGRQMTPRQREAIAKQCFTFIAKGGFELLYLMERPEDLKRHVTFVHRERLDACLTKGKGVILVSAHFGNFPLMVCKLSLEGYRTAGIMRRMRDFRAERFFNSRRNKLGVVTIYSQPRRACVEDTIRRLRRNEIVFIPIDQNFGTGGIFVDFFGTKAATATGPAILAQRTGASILPCFIIRKADDTHEILFEEPLSIGDFQAEKDPVHGIIQHLTSLIESYIRRYPYEWGWIHRRWKSKPKEV